MPFRFEDLRVYQRTLELVDHIYDVVDKFPTHELYTLSSQLRRAVISILLNIAEGTGRTNKEFAHFVDMSRTSAYECIACLAIALRRKYITQQSYETLYAEINEIVRMLNALKNSINNNTVN
ncbi:four helix bundle protein [Candidatus Uhrbacteria bacterium]|nr:four helix bundle protein [Candidatus Uhrbacteria bacterium]